MRIDTSYLYGIVLLAKEQYDRLRRKFDDQRGIKRVRTRRTGMYESPTQLSDKAGRKFSSKIAAIVQW